MDSVRVWREGSSWQPSVRVGRREGAPLKGAPHAPASSDGALGALHIIDTPWTIDGDPAELWVWTEHQIEIAPRTRLRRGAVAVTGNRVSGGQGLQSRPEKL